MSFLNRLQKDRKRQEQLARERLEQRKKLAKAKKEARQRGELGSMMEAPTVMSIIPMPENENDKVAMQEVVVKELEVKHSEERDLLIQVCNVSYLINSFFSSYMLLIKVGNTVNF